VASLPATEKGVSIKTTCDSNITTYADYDTLLTIIRNLLSNAIKFTPTGGKISVKASASNHHVTIQVTDTGIGIAPENLNNLFKLDGFTTKGTNSENGTGLGLMLCKEFAEANGGSISVSSTMGKGTTFTITLPSNKA
jgi:signal transduction histidine kinase